MTFNTVKNLVTILTPCYNGAKVIHRLLDSVLVQDYPHIEMIVVDDGSTDNSKETIESYKSKFEEKRLFFVIHISEQQWTSSCYRQRFKVCFW